jgi:hypothetical protein
MGRSRKPPPRNGSTSFANARRASLGSDVSQKDARGQTNGIAVPSILLGCQRGVLTDAWAASDRSDNAEADHQAHQG